MTTEYELGECKFLTVNACYRVNELIYKVVFVNMIFALYQLYLSQILY